MFVRIRCQSYHLDAHTGIRQALDGFKWILRAHHQPHVIGHRMVEHILRQHKVPIVNGVERAEEESRAISHLQ